MRMRPRQQLLDLWRAHLRTSFRDGRWVWGGRDGRNSISEAEHLLGQEFLQVSDAMYSPRFKELEAIRQSLDRATEIRTRRPHTADALAADALLRLDALAHAREDAGR
ncbi:hypothetical protein ACWZHB_21905 [Nocardia sp. FBN12]|uniref:hypothetical protein n=1 Tax=Nocardia sp. FBN12 TaxID=3419766 RepID=UPI003CFF5397